jgi:hypothetical protein
VKLSIEKVRNWNTVAQFIAIVLLGVFVLIQAILHIISQFPRSEPGIQIVKEELKTEIIQSVNYSALLRDTYVFSLESSAIVERDGLMAQKSVASYERTPANKEIVNFYFVSGESKKETALLDENALILDHQFINDSKSNGYILDKNLYAIVAKDTNGDKRLSTDDTIDLYASDYNGLGRRQIGNDIYSYQIINDNIILFTEAIDNKLVFKTYNAKENKIETIKTTEQKPEKKEFNRVFY